jgi:hypothetical protein
MCICRLVFVVLPACLSVGTSLSSFLTVHRLYQAWFRPTSSMYAREAAIIRERNTIQPPCLLRPWCVACVLLASPVWSLGVLMCH